MNVRKALGLSAIAQFVTFTLGFVNVIVVSRLLTPEEIGIFSVAVSILGIAHVFREFGVNQYLVQAREVGKKQFRAAFSLTLLTSWSIAAVLFLVRTPLAGFYAHSGIAEVLELMAFNFILLPFGTPLLAMLRRELQFGTLAGVKITNAVATSIVTIGTALAGESYLSMAWGALAGHLTNIVVLNVIRSGQIFMLPTFTGLRELVRFGSLSSLTTLINEIGFAAPDLILGRTLGFSAVAYYSRAAGLRDMFLKQLHTLVNGVHFPTFAERIRAGERADLLYCRATGYMTSITIPTMTLLAFLADPLIRFFFGTQWERAAPLASLLCLFAILTAPYALANPSLVAAGQVHRTFKIALVVQTLRVATLATSIWLPLERVVPLLGLVFFVEAAMYQYSLKKSFSLGFSFLLNEIKTSLLLIPFTMLGPILITYTFPMPDFVMTKAVAYLAVAGLSALTGWLFGLAIMKHPLGAEISAFASRVRTKS